MQMCEIALDAVLKDANVDDVYYAIYCILVEIVPHPTLCVFAVKPAIDDKGIYLYNDMQHESCISCVCCLL